MEALITLIDGEKRQLASSDKKQKIKFEDEESKPTCIEGSGRSSLPQKDKKGAMYVEELNLEATPKQVEEMENTMKKFMTFEDPLNEQEGLVG